MIRSIPAADVQRMMRVNTAYGWRYVREIHENSKGQKLIVVDAPNDQPWVKYLLLREPGDLVEVLD